MGDGDGDGGMGGIGFGGGMGLGDASGMGFGGGFGGMGGIGLGGVSDGSDGMGGMGGGLGGTLGVAGADDGMSAFGEGFGLDSFGLDSGLGLADMGNLSIADQGMTGLNGLSGTLGVLGMDDDDDDAAPAFTKNLTKNLTNMALNALMGKLGIPSQMGIMGKGLAQSAMTGKNAPAAMGFTNAALSTMGPLGMAIGLGIQSGMLSNDSQGPAGGSTGLGGIGVGDLATGLAGLYMGNRQANQYGKAISSLNDIYSPNSPYAQQLRQRLERKDAAAGRRSQYGPREAQLAAMLAQEQSRMMTSPGYGNMMQQQLKGKNQPMLTALALLNKSGALKNFNLNDLFSGFGGGGSGASLLDGAGGIAGGSLGGGMDFGSAGLGDYNDFGGFLSGSAGGLGNSLNFWN